MDFEPQAWSNRSRAQAKLSSSSTTVPLILFRFIQVETSAGGTKFPIVLWCNTTFSFGVGRKRPKNQRTLLPVRSSSLADRAANECIQCANSLLASAAVMGL
jgi:hypothetical protein